MHVNIPYKEAWLPKRSSYAFRTNEPILDRTLLETCDEIHCRMVTIVIVLWHATDSRLWRRVVENIPSHLYCNSTCLQPGAKALFIVILQSYARGLFIDWLGLLSMHRLLCRFVSSPYLFIGTGCWTFLLRNYSDKILATSFATYVLCGLQVTMPTMLDPRYMIQWIL